MLTAKGKPVCQVSTWAIPTTLPWPLIGAARNFVKRLSSWVSVRSATIFKYLPRVMVRPIPQYSIPNLLLFIFSRSVFHSSIATPPPSEDDQICPVLDLPHGARGDADRLDRLQARRVTDGGGVIDIRADQIGQLD